MNDLKIGIIGTGRIANRFVPEVHEVNGIGVSAVYNPNIESAARFAQKNNIPVFTDDLKRFFGNIDAVYIASPHETHCEYAKAALGNCKHVLCEKPAVLRKLQAEELFGIAKKNSLIFMEAIKTAYSPGFLRVIEEVNSGRLGEVRDVDTCFTKLTDMSLRELSDTTTGGSFTELASYTLLPIIKLLGANYSDVRFESIKAKNGVDIYTKAYFKYKDAFATSKTGLGVKSEGQLIISGTKGYIKVYAPWWKMQKFEVCFEDISKNEIYEMEFKGDGLRYELNKFVSVIKNEDIPNLNEVETIAIAEIIEKFLKSREQ